MRRAGRQGGKPAGGGNSGEPVEQESERWRHRRFCTGGKQNTNTRRNPDREKKKNTEQRHGRNFNTGKYWSWAKHNSKRHWYNHHRWRNNLVPEWRWEQGWMAEVDELMIGRCTSLLLQTPLPRPQTHTHTHTHTHTYTHTHTHGKEQVREKGGGEGKTQNNKNPVETVTLSLIRSEILLIIKLLKTCNVKHHYAMKLFWTNIHTQILTKVTGNWVNFSHWTRESRRSVT